jgi:hypothetical protein
MRQWHLPLPNALKWRPTHLFYGNGTSRSPSYPICFLEKCMKSLTLRSSVALAFALSLAGCGGGGGNLQLGGQVAGLIRGEVVLQDIKGGQEKTVPANSSMWFFDNLLRSDEDFEVKIKSSPEGLDCTLANAKGKTGSFSITTVNLACSAIPRQLSGTITYSGNIADIKGLELVNGTDKVTLAGDKASFAMSPVGDGFNYGVTVLTQPANHTCTVINGVGVMGHTNVTTIEVRCS